MSNSAKGLHAGREGGPHGDAAPPGCSWHSGARSVMWVRQYSWSHMGGRGWATPSERGNCCTLRGEVLPFTTISKLLSSHWQGASWMQGGGLGRGTLATYRKTCLLLWHQLPVEYHHGGHTLQAASGTQTELHAAGLSSSCTHADRTPPPQLSLMLARTWRSGTVGSGALGYPPRPPCQAWCMCSGPEELPHKVCGCG
jgi:hypothetical protein